MRMHACNVNVANKNDEFDQYGSHLEKKSLPLSSTTTNAGKFST